jgi:hypothetical protein
MDVKQLCDQHARRNLFPSAKRKRPMLDYFLIIALALIVFCRPLYAAFKKMRDTGGADGRTSEDD